MVKATLQQKALDLTQGELIKLSQNTYVILAFRKKVYKKFLK